jgi:hypothetical protein
MKWAVGAFALATALTASGFLSPPASLQPAYPRLSSHRQGTLTMAEVRSKIFVSLKALDIRI